MCRNGQGRGWGDGPNIEVNFLCVDPAYAKTFGLEIVGGRDFVQGFPASERDPNLNMTLIYAAVAYHNNNQRAKADELAQKVEESRAELSSGERLWLDWLQGLIRGDSESLADYLPYIQLMKPKG